MATLAQIRSRVSRKIKDPSNTGLSASDVDTEINRAIKFYSAHRFWFNEEMDDITLTSGNQVIPSIPSNINELSVNGILLIDDQVKIDLVKLLPDEFLERDDDQTGRPYFYTYRDGSFLVLPTPNDAYPIKFRYLEVYADLSGDSATNDFTDNAADLIMLRTISNIYSEDKEDPELGSFYDGLAEKEFRRLLRQTDGRNATGLLYGNSILETTYT